MLCIFNDSGNGSNVDICVIEKLLFEEFSKIQNEEGQHMDLYIPKNSATTDRLITSKDLDSFQINVDESVRYTCQFSSFGLCGFVSFPLLPSTDGLFLFSSCHFFTAE
uniref:Uncharacterized protein n=1 Tax=Lactuca sativa TaxID=4236 RepID=A0A9R1WJA0_LACSA|nr:hypothetical protein LSAT_V11C200080870 [Lactuca sativa]